MAGTTTDNSLQSAPRAQARQDFSSRKHRRTEKSLQGDTVVPRHLFTTLPFELLAEILIYTNSPKDVLAVARCNKFFCQTLVHRTSDYIWQSVRRTCSSPPPEPMSIFTEASYAAFLFGGGICEVCKMHTEELYTAFGTRVRLCHDSACKTEFMVKGDSVIHLYMTLPHHRKIEQCIAYAENVRYFPLTHAQSCKIHRNSEVTRETHEYLADPNGYLEKKQKQIAFIEKYMEFCRSLDKWKTSRQNLYNETVDANETFFQELVQKNGWVEWDLMSSTPYGSMHRLKTRRIERVTQKDYDSIAFEVERTIARLASQRERKGREAAYSNNRYAVEQHYQRLRSQQPRISLPSLEAFRRLPIVQLLQGTSPETVEFPPKEHPHDVSTTLRKEKWVVDRLKTELQQWRDKARKDLETVLGYSSWTTLYANANSNVVPPVDRVTARFLCKTCSKVASKYREDNCLDFAGACAHFCIGKKKDKRVDGIWTAEHFVKDEKAITVLQNLLSMCGTEASFPEAITTLKSLGTTIQCISCGPGIVLNSSSLVGHSHRHEKMTIRLLSKEEISNVLLHPPQPSIVRTVTGSEPRFQAVRLQLIFGCRHCLTRQMTPVETQPQLQSTEAEAESSQQAKLSSESEATTNTKPSVLGDKHVAKRFSFPGITSHLKTKHGILDVRDEDIFSFDPIELHSKSK